MLVLDFLDSVVINILDSVVDNGTSALHSVSLVVVFINNCGN